MEANLSNPISVKKWKDSTRKDYSTLHQLAPYIGKMKPTMAKELIINFTKVGDTVWDPYVGSGTIALEAIIEGRNIICNDINPYAYTLTKAKINPPRNIVQAKKKAEKYLKFVKNNTDDVELSKIPQWVKNFFHPKTLKETVLLSQLLKADNEHFLHACLLGILHHQRPGFLSYPASNLVPYLRTNKFPKSEYPEMYSYREISPRLKSKLERVYKRFPDFNYSLMRECYLKSATDFKDKEVEIDSIITSPPYMNNLDYARDNRLRLWFLGIENFKPLDESIKNENLFSQLVTKTLEDLKCKLKSKGKLILVLGNKNKKEKIVNIVENIIENVKGFSLIYKLEDKIPDIRRTRKNMKGTKKETILVYKKKN